MRVKQTYNIFGADNVFFAAVQGVAAGEAFILNGGNQPDAIGLRNYQSQISFTSALDNSGANLTVSGYSNGAFVEETLAGPDNDIVETLNYYSVVTSVTTDAVVTACSMGNAGEAVIPIRSNLGSDSFITAGCWSIYVYNPDATLFEILGTHNYNSEMPFLASTVNQTFGITGGITDTAYYIPPSDTTILDAVIVQMTPGNNPLIVNYISV